VLFLTLLFMTV